MSPKRMMLPKVCAHCDDFRTSIAGPKWRSYDRHWGPGFEVERVPGCEECYIRHQGEVHTLYVENRNLESLELKSSLEINKLKADNICLREKVQFLQLRRDSLHADVVFAGPGRQIAANRTILAAKSPLFQHLVVSETAAKPTKVRNNIDKLASPVFEAMVDFCYTGDIVFSELVAPDEVLKLAHIFELRLLMEYCDQELCRRLTVDNMPQMLKLSLQFEAKELQEAAEKLFREHFDALKSKVYDVLEGPACGSSFSQPTQATCQN